MSWGREEAAVFHARQWHDRPEGTEVGRPLGVFIMRVYPRVLSSSELLPMRLQIFSLLYYFWNQGVNYRKWCTQMALCCLGMGCFRVPQILCEVGNFEMRPKFMRCSLLSFPAPSIAENKWGTLRSWKKLSALRDRFRVGRDNCT